MVTVVTSDRSEEVAAAGILTELPGCEGPVDLLRAARLLAAMEMLRRSGFDLILLPPGAAVLKSRRRWWRRERST